MESRQLGSNDDLVSLGWILFRADSPAQASRMLRTLVSPGSYSTHSLDLSLYLLVFLIAVGYAIVLQATGALDRYAPIAEKSAFWSC